MIWSQCHIALIGIFVSFTMCREIDIFKWHMFRCKGTTVVRSVGVKFMDIIKTFVVMKYLKSLLKLVVNPFIWTWFGIWISSVWGRCLGDRDYDLIVTHATTTPAGVWRTLHLRFLSYMYKDQIKYFVHHALKNICTYPLLRPVHQTIKAGISVEEIWL